MKVYMVEEFDEGYGSEVIIGIYESREAVKKAILPDKLYKYDEYTVNSTKIEEKKDNMIIYLYDVNGYCFIRYFVTEMEVQG